MSNVIDQGQQMLTAINNFCDSAAPPREMSHGFAILVFEDASVEGASTHIRQKITALAVCGFGLLSSATPVSQLPSDSFLAAPPSG